ncbi:hypothetical protein [Corynebacterium efficiens YS-314]|uniref:Uncharacterized protein n=1 Tax=Corynebacterium efficiens (strain DSM 44549 / YS-314 / AJ 12310 / JCM 11189 / NBRC 100395) TaxID=196164 RepID=Q8FN08_COREF|nr:hypothetical protein [Corynebacterium efficiens YS-314]
MTWATELNLKAVSPRAGGPPSGARLDAHHHGVVRDFIACEVLGNIALVIGILPVVFCFPVISSPATADL